MSSEAQKDPHIVTIHDVRLSYANLFRAKHGKNPDGSLSAKATFSAAFLMEKVRNREDIARLTAAAVFTKQEKWQGKPVNLAGKSIRDGLEKEATEGYGPSITFISARSDKKPRVVDQNLNDLPEDSGKPYSGCYVDATVRCWAQDNANGKRLNWALVNVQYRRKGDPFGEKQIPVESTLGKLPDEDATPVDDNGI